MKKLWKRALSLALAAVTFLGTVPAALFLSSAESAIAPEKTETSYDYSSLYVKEGLVFQWSGFDLKEGDPNITVLENQVGDQDVAFTGSATPFDGYLSTKAIFDFTPFLEGEWMGDEGEAYVIGDFTFEVHLRQIDGGIPAPTGPENANASLRRGTFTAPTLSGIAMRADNLNEASGINNWQNKYPIDESYGFISETYATLAPLTGTANVGIPTDVNYAKTKWLGNTRYIPYAFALRMDYTTTEEDPTRGTVMVDYIRDFKTVRSTTGAYDARYYGNFKSGTLQYANPDNQTLSFGGLGYGYSMIRVYNRALADEEMQKNHVADLLSYYKIDPACYTSLSENDQKEAREMLGSYYMDATTEEDILAVFETVAIPTIAEIYHPLYVQNGLIYQWDGFDLSFDGETFTSFDSFLSDGQKINRMTNGREYNGIGTGGTGISLGNTYRYDKSVLKAGTNRILLLTNLLPFREDENGVTLPSDMTLEATLMYPSAYKTSPAQETPAKSITGFNGGVLFLGPLGSAGKGVGYLKANANYDMDGPMKGQGSLSTTVTGPFASWQAPLNTLDKGTTAFLGNYPDKVFYMAFSFDYDEKETDTENILYDFKAYRDGKEKFTYKSNYSASVDYSAYDGEATQLQLTFGIDVTTQYYAFRLYDRALTEAEMMQNHAVDLFKYYGVDVSEYKDFDYQTAERLHTTLASYQIGETSKEELASILHTYALTGGLLGIVEITDYMTFLGVQARTDDYAALRLRYEVSRESIESLDEIGAFYSFGAMYAKKSDVASKDEMVITFNPTIHEFTKSDGNYTLIPAYHGGEFGEKLDYLKDDGKVIDFGVKLPSVEKEDFASGAIEEEYYVRGYLAIYLNNSYFVMYLDTDEGVFGESISIAEAAEYFVCNGYAFAEIPSLLTDPSILIGARASNELYLSANSEYKTIISSIDILGSAYKGANVSAESFTEIDALMAKVNMSDASTQPSYEQAVQYAKQAATARAELNIYFDLGLKAYQEASALSEKIEGNLQARYETTYQALLASGLDETAAKGTADRITKALSDALGMASEKVTELENAYQTLLSVQEKLGTSQAELKLQKIIGASSSLFIEGTTVARYIIITKSEYLPAAKSLQEFFIANQGAFVGIYEIDNPYIGGMHDFSGTNAIFVGLTDEKLGAQNTYSVYYDNALASLCIEGFDAVSLTAGASAFLHRYCLGEGRIRITGETIGDTLIGQSYTAMYEMNLQTEFPKINISEVSVVGVMEGFMQRLSEMPDHVTVVPLLSNDDFTYSNSLTVYVATDGLDTNDGSFDRPFATIERALEAVAFSGGATVMIRGGTYSLDETVTLSSAHSGTLTNPLFITNYQDEKVVFTTGKSFSGNLLVPVKDADFLPSNAITRLNKFKADNAQNVYALDLTSLGLTKADLADYASGENSPGLYVCDQNYRVCRYPNADAADDSSLGIKDGSIKSMNSQEDVKEVGYVASTFSSVYEENKKNPNNFFELYFDQTTYADRLLSYDQEAIDAGMLWMHGAIYEEWDKQTVRIKLFKDDEGRNYMRSNRSVQYGVKYGASNRVYFFNMLEELDTALEYQVDVENMVLYLYAEKSLADLDMTLCYASHAAFLSDGASNIVFDGLNFERTYGYGVHIKNAERAVVQNCVFRNLSGYAAVLANCMQSGVTYSEFYSCNGVSLSAGNGIASLVAERNFIQNNRFTNAGDTHDMTIAIGFSGVANVISHNYFYETRLSIGRAYECVIEYNEFDRGPQYAHDSGPIYSNDAARALHIRYNYLHDLNKAGYGIYLDDMTSGEYVYGNIVHFADGAATGRAINLHNSSMCVVINNILLNVNGSGIENNINYYAKKVNGVSTGGGGLSYRFKGILTGRLALNGNYLPEEVRYSRFPMYAAYTEVVNRALQQMDRTADWNSDNKITPDENDEIYVRTPLYNVYMHNVAFGCKQSVLTIPNVGRDTARIASNISFAKSTEGVLKDYANGDYSIPSDSLIYKQIENFYAPDMSLMGVLAD